MLDFHSGLIMCKRVRTLLTVTLATAGIGVTPTQKIQLVDEETAPAPQFGAQNIGSSMQGTDHGSMQDMDHGSMKMQDSSAPPDAHDPDVYSDGYQFGTGKYTLDDSRHMMMMADAHNSDSMLVDRLGWMHGNDVNVTTYELQTRFGSVYNEAVLKTEGDVSKRHPKEARTELLWNHAVTTFQDTQLGMWNDMGSGRLTRNWVAFDV